MEMRLSSCAAFASGQVHDEGCSSSRRLHGRATRTSCFRRHRERMASLRPGAIRSSTRKVASWCAISRAHAGSPCGENERRSPRAPLLKLPGNFLLVVGHQGGFNLGGGPMLAQQIRDCGTCGIHHQALRERSETVSTPKSMG